MAVMRNIYMQQSAFQYLNLFFDGAAANMAVGKNRIFFFL